jgi:hypothetical protein
MSPLSHTDQLRYIVDGRVREAVELHAQGDWSRRHELFDLPRSVFDDWVDSVAGLPTQHVHLESNTFDGIYLVQDSNHWLVYEQERGWTDPVSVARHLRFDEAKRDACARNYLWCLSLR